MCLQCCPVPYNVCSIFFSWSLFLSDEIQIISTYILLCLSNIFQEDFYNFFLVRIVLFLILSCLNIPICPPLNILMYPFSFNLFNSYSF